MKFSNLPALGGDLEGGTFAGLTTSKDGTHHAVVWLSGYHGTELTWKRAMNWAKKLDAALPSRHIAALLVHNLKDKLQSSWHWTSEEDNASYAWSCYFSSGCQHSYSHKSSEESAVAVRLIEVTQ